MAVFNLAAGHGANDSGAVLGSRYEKNDNLRMAIAVETELVKRGHKVNQFRRDDTANCSWSACREWLGRTPCDCGIVFHRNSYSKASANGVEVWSFDVDLKATELAAAVSSAIASASGMYNRGRKGNGAAWINAGVLSIEPEIGFLSNDGDNVKFDTHFDKIVCAICDTLENCFGKAVSDDVIAIGTTTNYLNIRKAPVTGAVLTSMPTGSKCNIYSIENGWAKVSYGGYEGYSSTDYMTIEYIIKEETSKVEAPKEEVKQIYRVRKSRDDASSQVGAYSVLDNAIEKAEANKCNVYDTDGNLVWEYTEKSEPAETPAMEENKSFESDSKGSTSEDNSSKEVTPKTEETPKLPEESEPKADEGTSFDDTVPAFIKLLKKIVDIILSLWRKA